MRKLAVFVALFAVTNVAYGQEQQGTYEEIMVEEVVITNYSELLRSNIRANKVAIITAEIPMTSEESTAFWPIYREYELEVTKIWDDRIALINTFAENQPNLTENLARDLAFRSMDADVREIGARREAYNRIQDATNPILAAKWLQLENQISRLVGLQVASELPPIEPTTTTNEGTQ